MCTSLSFLDALNCTYVGRTLEFAGDMPWNVSYFPKDLNFTSAITATKNGISYKTSKAFISITLNTSPQGTPGNPQNLKVIHGLNEAGLNFGANAFGLTDGPVIEQDKIPSALAFIDIGSWALGQFSTVAELQTALKQQIIYCTPLAAMNSNTTPLHCIFYDVTGASLVLEFVDKQMKIYQNPWGVMTNAPEFSWHLTNLNNYTNLSNIDTQTQTFNTTTAGGTQQLSQPDSGIATSVIPGANNSPGRFIKAFYYSQFAAKNTASDITQTQLPTTASAPTAPSPKPDQSVYMLSHIMNNFDRPIDITYDPPSSSASPEGKGPSEFTVWTALSDLSRRKFFVRNFTELNYQHFDLYDLSEVTTFKTIPYMKMYQGLGDSNSQALINA